MHRFKFANCDEKKKFRLFYYALGHDIIRLYARIHCFINGVANSRPIRSIVFACIQVIKTYFSWYKYEMLTGFCAKRKRSKSENGLHENAFANADSDDSPARLFIVHASCSNTFLWQKPTDISSNKTGDSYLVHRLAGSWPHRCACLPWPEDSSRPGGPSQKWTGSMCPRRPVDSSSSLFLSPGFEYHHTHSPHIGNHCLLGFSGATNSNWGHSSFWLFSLLQNSVCLRDFLKASSELSLITEENFKRRKLQNSFFKCALREDEVAALESRL